MGCVSSMVGGIRWSERGKSSSTPSIEDTNVSVQAEKRVKVSSWLKKNQPFLNSNSTSPDDFDDGDKTLSEHYTAFANSSASSWNDSGETQTQETCNSKSEDLEQSLLSPTDKQFGENLETPTPVDEICETHIKETPILISNYNDRLGKPFVYYKTEDSVERARFAKTTKKGQPPYSNPRRKLYTKSMPKQHKTPKKTDDVDLIRNDDANYANLWSIRHAIANSWELRERTADPLGAAYRNYLNEVSLLQHQMSQFSPSHKSKYKLKRKAHFMKPRNKLESHMPRYGITSLRTFYGQSTPCFVRQQDELDTDSFAKKHRDQSPHTHISLSRVEKIIEHEDFLQDYFIGKRTTSPTVTPVLDPEPTKHRATKRKVFHRLGFADMMELTRLPHTKKVLSLPPNSKKRMTGTKSNSSFL